MTCAATSPSCATRSRPASREARASGPRILHGDYRLGNMQFDGERPGRDHRLGDLVGGRPAHRPGVADGVHRPRAAARGPARRRQPGGRRRHADGRRAAGRVHRRGRPGRRARRPGLVHGLLLLQARGGDVGAGQAQPPRSPSPIPAWSSPRRRWRRCWPAAWSCWAEARWPEPSAANAARARAAMAAARSRTAGRPARPPRPGACAPSRTPTPRRPPGGRRRAPPAAPAPRARACTMPAVAVDGAVHPREVPAVADGPQQEAQRPHPRRPAGARPSPPAPSSRRPAPPRWP